MDWYPGRLDIDLSALAANFTRIKAHLGSSRKLIPVLKADGYGHGCGAAGDLLTELGTDLIAVGSLTDAATIRSRHKNVSILLLSAFAPSALPAILALDVIPMIETVEGAQALASATARPILIFVKVDSGFGRFGAPAREVVDLVAQASLLPRIRIEGVFTHIPFSDLQGRDWALDRLAEFGRITSELARKGLQPRYTQALSSPAVYVGLKDDHNAVAVGHLLFGLCPVKHELQIFNRIGPLRPVLSAIRTVLVHVGSAPEIARAHPYLRDRADRRLGVIPIGMHHGYRPATDKAHVLVHGVRAPVLRVCLENTIIDLSEVRDAAIEDPVTVVGEESGSAVRLEDLAHWQGTSPLATLLPLSRSLERHFLC